MEGRFGFGILLVTVIDGIRFELVFLELFTVWV